MFNRWIIVVGLAGTVGAAVVGSGQSTPPANQNQATPPAGATQAPVRSGGIVVPTITLGPGLTPVPNYNEVAVPEPSPQMPEGFTPLFNGKDLSGWHVSKTARHGHSPEFRVVHGVLVGTQHPYAQGGMLVTDRKYGNFELTLEAKPDWGCDSGIFFRTTETGAAYQITMDYLGNANGNIGRLIGEGGISLAAGGGTRGAGGGPGTPSAAAQAWKREDWNVIRVRVEGAAPKVSVSINNQLVNEQHDSANHALDGMTAEVAVPYLPTRIAVITFCWASVGPVVISIT